MDSQSTVTLEKLVDNLVKKMAPLFSKDIIMSCWEYPEYKRLSGRFIAISEPQTFDGQLKLIEETEEMYSDAIQKISAIWKDEKLLGKGGGRYVVLDARVEISQMLFGLEHRPPIHWVVYYSSDRKPEKCSTM